MAKKKSKVKKRHYIKTLCLTTLVLALSYFIFSANVLEPRINSIATSYISFNNSYSTDMLKINNIVKMHDEKGESSRNRKKINIKITGDENKSYQIVVYPINSEIDAQYIKYSVHDGKSRVKNILSEMPMNKDGGRIIYTSEVKKNTNLTVNMWISTDYKSRIKDNSYEIKIMEKV